MSQRAATVRRVDDTSDASEPVPGDAGPTQYPEILTTAMAARMLHVHVEYLRRMVREQRIPAHRFPGGREIRFLRDELIAWVREQPGEDRSPSATDRSTR
jgi:excisionase family DNA binding protein